MFTRYSNIDIPQNYSGSRFNKQIIEDTETKIHSTPIQGATKSSVSPTFEYNKSFIAEEEKIEEASIQIEDDNSSLEDVHNEDNSNSLGVLSQLSDYFKKINSDDLLLIALIIFLLNDHDMNNNDIIIILSLMLIYHQ